MPKIPLPDRSIHDLLVRNAASFPRKEAIITVDVDSGNQTTITHQELLNLVEKTATHLALQGITKGDRLAILMHNSSEILIIELAAGILGATTVPLDVKRDTFDRKIFKIKDTSAKLLLFKKEDKQFDTEVTKIIASIPLLKVDSWDTFESFVSLLPEKPQLPKLSCPLTATYLILYTSGTTAQPKGTILTQNACLLNAIGIIDWQKFTQEDRFNIVLPLHHINSTEFCLAMLLVGGTIILNSRYSTSSFWKVIAQHQATNTSIVPTILHDLLVREAEFKEARFNISSLKRICIGSAPVLPEETLRFYNTFRIRVVQGYGQTETALRVAGVPVDIDDNTYKELVKSNTIGTQLANNDLAIMDQDNNEMLEAAHGEICIAGPILADGYLNSVEETKKAFIDGWFHSGDLGYWKYADSTRSRKFFFIIGRLKEIIIKGGVNISPSSIEDALLNAIPEIDEVSVVGYPEERMGEEIAAVIVPKSRLRHTSRSGFDEKGLTLSDIPGLSTYETPSKVFFVDTLPKTSTGKIQRVEVKKMVAEWIKKESNKRYFVRTIEPSEQDVLAAAVAINNDRWHGLPSTLKEFKARAQNGILLGVFEETNGLMGSLSCVQLALSEVEKLTTWNEATSNGTLANHNPHGDTLLCVAISVKSYSSNMITEQYNNKDEEKLKYLAKSKIAHYVNSNEDHVLSFHIKPKGGLPGATVWKILENGRSDDHESMGYNVLMKYPEINEDSKITRSHASPASVLLMEHVILYAKSHGVNHVIAFSRPAGFRKYLTALQG